MKPFASLLTLSVRTSLAGAASFTPVSAVPEPISLEEYVVTASAWLRPPDDLAVPTSVVAGAELDRQRQATLGETLAAQPGVASTYFGPGASRPVIRGLGGDRIRVLTGGIGSLDASVLSPDHAVSIDPMLIERIEIVRGPATLMYGGSAIGGVVNVIDARLPESLPTAPLSGRLAAQYGSAADERSVGALLAGAVGPVAWHLDGFTRETDDLRIPGFAETEARREEHEHDDEDDHEEPAFGVLPNSATRTQGAGFALSWFGRQGHFGVSTFGLNSRYGVPGHEHGHHHEDEPEPDEDLAEHEEVQLDLRQRRWDGQAELLEPVSWLQAARLQFGVARYAHDELEGDAVGTRFSNRAYEGRLELRHHPLGPWAGALGFQVARSDLTAEGDEAFLPPHVTTTRAVFLFEEWVQETVTWQWGVRAEHQTVAPRGPGAASRLRHTPLSGSAGWVWQASPADTLAVSLARSERAPQAQELLADGPHLGTGAYERGDANLGLERATTVDLSWRRRQGWLTGEVTFFAAQFDNFIVEQETGEEEDELPVRQFTARGVRQTGGELEIVAHLHEGSRHTLDLRLTADLVRVRDRADGSTLPRVTPPRLGWALDYRAGPLSLTAEMRHTQAPRRLAPGETATDGFTLFNARAAWRFRWGSQTAELFLRGTNLTDRTGRHHTSYLKDLAPLSGRDLAAGLSLQF